MAWCAVYGRHPQGVQTLFSHRVADGFAVRGVANLAARAWITFDRFHRLQSLKIQNLYHHGAARYGLRLKCQILSVGRYVDAAATEQCVGEFLGSSSVHGNLLRDEFSVIEAGVN